MGKSRLLNERDALAYIQMGKTFGRAWLRRIGADRHFGRMLRYDQAVIDRYLDQLSQDQPRGA